MENAADKAAKSESKKNARRPVDEATPQAKAQERWAKSEKERKKRNPVVDTYWELVSGKKLILCKKTKTGSVHKTFVGSTDSKEYGDQIKAQVNKLQADGKLKVRV